MTKRFMIEQLYEKWNVTPPSTLNEFTGYESVYPHLDTFTNEQYDRYPDTVTVFAQRPMACCELWI